MYGSKEICKDFDKMDALKLTLFESECIKMITEKDKNVDARTLQLLSSTDLQQFIKSLREKSATQLQIQRTALLDERNKLTIALQSVEDNLVLVQHQLDSEIGEEIQLNFIINSIVEYKLLKRERFSTRLTVPQHLQRTLSFHL